MIRVAVVVEGQTEREFVRGVLSEHLMDKGIFMTAILPGKGRRKRGGNVSVERLAGSLAKCYWSFNAVTSLVDYYGFRGKKDRTVEQLEDSLSARSYQSISGNLDSRKIFPYVQRHEFEGLLFSDVRAFSALPDAPSGLAASLKKIRDAFGTPEDINDGKSTAPSKRILNLMPEYDKVAYGSVLARRIGIDVIRETCPRFDHWVRRLESLGSSTGG